MTHEYPSLPFWGQPHSPPSTFINIYPISNSIKQTNFSVKHRCSWPSPFPPLPGENLTMIRLTARSTLLQACMLPARFFNSEPGLLGAKPRGLWSAKRCNFIFVICAVMMRVNVELYRNRDSTPMENRYEKPNRTPHKSLWKDSLVKLWLLPIEHESLEPLHHQPAPMIHVSNPIRCS